MRDPANGCPHADVLQTSLRRPPRSLYEMWCRDCDAKWTRPTMRFTEPK